MWRQHLQNEDLMAHGKAVGVDSLKVGIRIYLRTPIEKFLRHKKTSDHFFE